MTEKKDKFARAALLSLAFTLFLPFSPAQAAASPALENYKLAIGHAVATFHPIRILWQGQAYEMKGTLEDEISSRRWREHTNLPDAPYDDLMTYQDDQIFERDPNGQLQKQSGNAFAKTLTLYAILSGKWITEGGSITDLPNDEKGRPRVRWTPSRSAVAEVTFGKDHLPALVLIDQGGGQMLQFEFSDWSIVADVLLPRKQVIRDPNIEQRVTWELQSASKFDDQAFKKMEAHVDWHLPKDQAFVTLPLSLYQNRYIQVPVSFGSVHSVFILDTGASSTCISQSLARKLNLPFKGKMTQTSGIFKDAFFVKSPLMDVGGAQIDPQTIIALDLDGGEFGAAIPGIGGILGFDFLSRFVVIVDYQGGRLQLAPIDHFKPQNDDEPISVENDQGSLMVSLKINGKPSKFILDTGNGGGIAIQHVDGQERWVTPTERKHFFDPEGLRFGSGIAGVWKSYVDVSIGSFVWPRAPVSIADPHSAKGGSLAISGNVGSAFLKQFRVSIDMKTPRLWLAQTVPFRDRKAYTTFGLSFTSDPQGAKVRSMDIGGPAAKAGLKVGDVVTKINAMDAAKALPHLASLTMDAVVGETLHLRVLRGQKVLEMTIKAEAIP